MADQGGDSGEVLTELRKLLRTLRNYRLLGFTDGPIRDPVTVGVLERGAAAADAANDLSLAMEARTELVRAAYWAGEPDKALVTFAWCLAQSDRHPELLDTDFARKNLLWLFKWLVDMIPLYPQIPAAKIQATLDEMERRYTAAGYNLRPVEANRCAVALHTGDFGRAAEHERRWAGIPRDSMADCAACEASEHVRYLLAMGSDAKAIVGAGPLLGGELKCNEVPHNTFSQLLIPALRLGRDDLAAECHRRGDEYDFTGVKHIDAQGRHIAYLALAGRLTAAVERLERALPGALETRKLGHRFPFFLGARLLTRRLAETGHESVRLRLPKEFPLHRGDGVYPTADLAWWFLVEAEKLAVLFDRRNGNDWFARRVVENERLMELARSVAAVQESSG